MSEKGNQAVYQYVEQGHHCDEHLHLKCVKCGCIIHLECDFMREIAEHIKKDHGFELQCKNSIIYGMCSKCQENEQQLMRKYDDKGVQEKEQHSIKKKKKAQYVLKVVRFFA